MMIVVVVVVIVVVVVVVVVMIMIPPPGGCGANLLKGRVSPTWKPQPLAPHADLRTQVVSDGWTFLYDVPAMPCHSPSSSSMSERKSTNTSSKSESRKSSGLTSVSVSRPVITGDILARATAARMEAYTTYYAITCTNYYILYTTYIYIYTHTRSTVCYILV